jgi:hypothetical protein
MVCSGSISSQYPTEARQRSNGTEGNDVFAENGLMAAGPTRQALSRGASRPSTEIRHNDRADSDLAAGVIIRKKSDEDAPRAT